MYFLRKNKIQTKNPFKSIFIVKEQYLECIFIVKLYPIYFFDKNNSSAFCNKIVYIVFP